MADERSALRDALSRYMPLKTAADWCDDNAEKFGHREALVDSRRRLTWSRVKELSDALALALLGFGLERDATVLIQMPNSAELFLTRLACEKAGLRLVTVAPSLRRAELQPIVEFTRPTVAIIPAEYRGLRHIELLEQVRVPELQHVLMAWDQGPPGSLSLEGILSREVPEASRSQLQETRYGVEDVCQLATTSGSTGIPKCAAVPLYTRLLTSWNHLHRFQVSGADTLCAVTTIISGVADGLIYNGVCQAGGRVVLVDHFDPQRTCEIIAKEHVNVLPMVPTMISRLLAVPNLEDYDFRSLRMIVSHGSMLPYQVGVQVEDRLDCKIMQGYGSVDCGGLCATSWEDMQSVRLSSVGRPLDGNAIKVVDAEDREVNVGEVGHLWVRGLPSDARFFNNPELNARRSPDGFLDLQEWGRMDADGNVYLSGRYEELIIRGGQNIFPADIEQLLIRHSSVAEVAVVGIPDPEMGERVAAFVVCWPERSVTLSELREFLREEDLARFKWPEKLEVLDVLPKVVSGDKVDKNALRQRFDKG